MSNIISVIQNYLSLKPTTKVLGDYTTFFKEDIYKLNTTSSINIETIHIRSISANTFHAKINDHNVIFIDDCAVENTLNYFDFINTNFKSISNDYNAFEKALECKRYSRIFLENGFIFHSYIAMVLGKDLFQGLNYNNALSGLANAEPEREDNEKFKRIYILYCHFHEKYHVLLREGLINKKELIQRLSQLIQNYPGVEINVEEARKLFAEKGMDVLSQDYYDQYKQFIETDEFAKFYAANPFSFIENEESLDEFCCDLYACEQIFLQTHQEEDIKTTANYVVVSTFLNFFTRGNTIDSDWLLPLLYSLKPDELITESIINQFAGDYSANDSMRHNFVYELHLRVQFIQVEILDIIKYRFGENSIVVAAIENSFNDLSISLGKLIWELNGPITSWNNSLLEQIFLVTNTFQSKAQIDQFTINKNNESENGIASFKEIKKVLKDELILEYGLK